MSHFRALVCASFVALVACSVPAYAATQTVTNTSDSGAGSLRAALTSASAGDTIAFAPGVSGSIALVTTLPIAQSVTINGPGAANLTLDGQSTVQVIAISAGDVTISRVTIANGQNAGLGGGIGIASGASLTVRDSVFSGNAAGNGGAIANNAGGVLSVDQSTFEDNTTTGVGGGAIIASGQTSVTNSTFVGNTAPINGGAINVQSAGTLTLTNDTLFDNTSGSLGGALSNLGTTTISDSTFAANHGSAGSAMATGNSNLTIVNSVFSDNIASGSPGALSPTGLATDSNNVFFNNTAAGAPDDAAGYGTSNFVVATAEPLGALGDNAGPTQTMLPQNGGAAICAGSAALLPAGLSRDQRGRPRTALRGSDTCVDAGSVQASQSIVTLPTVVPTLSTWMLVMLGGLLAMFGMRRARAARR